MEDELYMQNKIKHLEFIQKVIDRQARNSFLLKGWIITIVVALFAFDLKGMALKSILSVYILIFIFWLLDSYYLWQEKLFRALYDHVRRLEEKDIDFDMSAKEFSKKVNCSWWSLIISQSIFLFYFSLMIFTIIFFNWR